MKYLVGCALALSFATTGSPIAHADSAPTCTDTPNSYTPGWQVGWAEYQAAMKSPSSGQSGFTTRTVDLPITINAPLAKVWTVYSNLRNDIGRHPFLQDIITHRTCNDGVVETIDFTALENVPMGSVDYPAKTQAEQRLYPADHYYLTDSYDQPDVITHQKITFTDNGNNTTTVNEHITFTADPALIGFTADNGTSSHRAYQAALKRDIENGTL
ncbi:hypothetical protein VMT65_02155 [Nocardia sp. CDC153]|uniref:hypothetical protein n=1 Tax=Nocardia sp. CDC153 TaxID=3112167 RepID=UPI002DBA515F|nr:hypothetical protein [Nocardia sp. CDC153]MEC3951828.1 hypothetical protein [Nocardia sp. CDC153]